MHLYRAFGAWIESAIELPWLAGTERPLGFAPADMTLYVRDAALHAQSAATPTFRSRTVTADGTPFLTAHPLEDGLLLQFAEGFNFVVGDERIDIGMSDAAQRHAVQMQLLGPVMAYWAERRGALALHASAVVMEDAAIAFTANSRGGKSTLAASFVQAGAALLSDDILPCHIEGMQVIAQPGFPSMRLWPAEAAQFIGDLSNLDFVHPAIDKRRADVGQGVFGRYHDAPARLACIYLPMRREHEAGVPCIEITQFSRGEALVELARLSFVARLAQVVQPQVVRLDLIAQIARNVAVKRLSYPSGYEHLPQVREAVMDDCFAPTKCPPFQHEE